LLAYDAARPSSATTFCKQGFAFNIISANPLRAERSFTDETTCIRAAVGISDRLQDGHRPYQ
jgi:hypothetical protein